MPAKPGQEVEELAARVVDALEHQRISLIGQLRATSDQPGTPGTDLVELARMGGFLAPRLADALGTDRATMERAVAQLEALWCVGRVKETAKVLAAYFIKYRYLDLSDASLPFRAATGHQPVMTQKLQLPDGAETFWKDAPHFAVTGVSTDCIAMIPSRITAAPWLGSLKPEEIIAATLWLTEMGFLEFALDDTVEIQASAGTSRVPVLRMNPSIQVADSEVNGLLVEAVRNAERNGVRWGELVVNRGIGVRALGAVDTYEIIDSASPNDIIRISTYHLRTVVGERVLADWIKEKGTMRVRVLCLGPTSVEGLTEGADPESLAASLARGIQGYRRVRQTLPRRLRRQVSIRVYGDAEDESFFRGAILAGSGSLVGTPKQIVASVWPYGESRANYGEVLRIKGHSNLARLLTRYYDRTWENSIPLPFYRNWELVGWIARSMKLEFVTALVIATIALVILAAWPDFAPDAAIFQIVGVLPILLIGMTRVGSRIVRVARLVVAIRRNE